MGTKKEFIEKIRKEIDEWYEMEKKYPHIITTTLRLKNRINKVIKEELKNNK